MLDSKLKAEQEEAARASLRKQELAEKKSTAKARQTESEVVMGIGALGKTKKKEPEVVMGLGSFTTAPKEKKPRKTESVVLAPGDLKPV